jgi:signal transduction histidine kinase
MKKDRKLILIIVLALLVLGLNAYVAYYSAQKIINNERRVVHTLEVLKELEALRTLSIDIESSMRGYVITGDAYFLQTYDHNKAQAPQIISHIRDLTKDNLYQQPQLELIETHVQEKFGFSDLAIKTRKEQGFAEAAAQVGSRQGKELMKEISFLADQMQEEETTLLKIRQDESDSSIRRGEFSFAATSILAALLLFGVYYFFNSVLEERRKSEEALRVVNEELESKVQERTEELERSNRELQDFAFVASHDLQEPLRKIQAFGDRLRLKYSDQLGDQGSDYLNRMYNAAQRMSRLISDLLAFSRVATKVQPFEPLNLNETIDGVLSDLETRIQQTNGTVEVEEMPTIAADALQMRQLFQNLIGNALKFHRPETPPFIQVKGSIVQENGAKPESDTDDSAPTEAADAHCLITVKDNGIGFDEKYLERIFTPFQRLHNKSEYEGTGMGLAVCRKIVERHRGTITAKSTPGEGSEFIITLPFNTLKGETE